jgi:aminoglycoside 2''-phosphotransferase
MIVPPNTDLISAIFPDPIETTHIHHGDDFFIVEVNSTWMFRFPRSQEAPVILEIEKRFLAEFSPISPIPVPQYRYIGTGFVGYKKIEGLLLSPARFKALPSENQNRVTGQIGAFLSAMHSFPIQRARQMGLTNGWNGWREKAFKTFRSEIAPRLSHQALRNSIACFEAFFASKYNPAVIHGDFFPQDHLFLDPQEGELCGIIDFGDLTIEDPACDFKNILSAFGEDVLQSVLASYTCPVDENIIDRMRLGNKVAPLFDAVYDVDFGYPGRLTHHIRDIEAAFGR